LSRFKGRKNTRYLGFYFTLQNPKYVRASLAKMDETAAKRSAQSLQKEHVKKRDESSASLYEEENDDDLRFM